MIMGLADFCNAICVSLQAPFFPQEVGSRLFVEEQYRTDIFEFHEFHAKNKEN
jgi:hypothetical protein